MNLNIIQEDYHQRCNEWIDEHHCPKLPVEKVSTPPPSPLEDSSQQTGPTIGPFTNCTHHATGLFSIVYTDKLRKLAIKVTVPSQTHPPHDPKREARILAAAAHPCIIPLLATHTLSSQFLLVFPFMRLDLATVLGRGFPLNVKSALQILQGLFGALAHIHSKGIIHRDIKPANILLNSPSDSPCLADFGIAWSPDDPASEPSDQKITDVGTTCYRPPELLFGHTAYGPEIDLWAAGCVVAECVRRGLCESENPSVKIGEIEWSLFDAGDLGSELALLKSIFETLGTPTDETWPVSSPSPEYETIYKYEHAANAYRNIRKPQPSQTGTKCPSASSHPNHGKTSSLSPPKKLEISSAG